MQQLANRSSESSRIAYKWKVLVTVIFGLFMVILDTTAVNVAFQALRQDFGASLGDAQWIISVYVLSIGISTPLAGFLADRFGMKRVYLAGLALFVLGSLLCGLSPSLWILVAARALQGLGGGVTLPLGVALLLTAFPPKEQGLALGIFGVAALVAPALGPILGGWLVDQNAWRLIFSINPPIGTLGVVLGSRLLHEITRDKRPALDTWGLITEVIGFGAVLYAASIAAEQGWTSPQVLGGFALGSAGLILFAVVELYAAKEPLLDLRLFKNRIFLNASLLGYMSVIALFGAEFLLPIYLQLLRGESAFQTGLILLPMAITGGVATPLAGQLYDRIGPRPLVAVGFAVLVVNTWQLSLLQPDTPIGWILFLLALRGIALGLTVQTTLVTALSVVPARELARGSSLTNATRQVVQSIGVAVLATVLASTLSVQAQAQQLPPAPPNSATSTHVALCQAPTGITANVTANRGATLSGIVSDDVCSEYVAGFERAYRVTFYAAIAAFLLGLALPGWPFKWGGRRAADEPGGPL